MFPKGARLLGDGRVAFPMKGPPPSDPPEGWHVDPNDDYIWVKDYRPCKHLTLLKMLKCPLSRRIRPHDFCELLKLKVNPEMCGNCHKIEKPTE